MTTINREAAEAWVTELESGRWKQGRGFLHTQSDRFCCLGVACSMAAAQGIVERGPYLGYSEEEAHFKYGADRDGVSLPYEVRTWLGIDNGVGVLSDRDIEKITPKTRLRVARESIAGDTALDGGNLAALNDTGVSFATIAQIIREVWLTDPE